jgi:hypothetical protein
MTGKLTRILDIYLLSEGPPWLKFMLYPPVFSSFTIWKLSVERPNGFKMPFPSC